MKFGIKASDLADVVADGDQQTFGDVGISEFMT